MRLRRPVLRIILLFSISILLLIVSCASTKYLGTMQPGLAADACGFYTKQCNFSRSGLTSDGTKTSIDGYYYLDNKGGGTYTFSGAVKVEIDHPVITNISYLNLTFLFFRGEWVVHEEKIKLYGDMGEYLEFSQTIKSDVIFSSSKWASFNWRASE
jgi:hypothetical protein